MIQTYDHGQKLWREGREEEESRQCWILVASPTSKFEASTYEVVDSHDERSSLKDEGRKKPVSLHRMDRSKALTSLSNSKGNTGSAARQASTQRNAAPEIPLVTKSPHTLKSLQRSSLLVLREIPSRKEPMKKTRDAEPA